MNGVEIAEHLLTDKPNAKELLISALPESETLAAEKGLPFPGKPFLPIDLVSGVRGMLQNSFPTQSGAMPRKRKVG